MAAASLPPAPERNADELRAAALLTLKAKRKRAPEQAQSQAAPSRPLAVSGPDSQALSLNYDDEPLPTPAAPVVLLPGDKDKEDGEISEAEVPVSARPKGLAIVPSTPPPPSATTSSTAVNENAPRTPIPDKLPADDPALLKSLLLPPSPTVARSAAARPPPPEELELRPLLQMPPDTLHEIKLHILDLLGMGVTPEYLVTYGIRQETIAYAFHELNLRLPYNLDLKGNETSLYPGSMNEQVKIPQPPPPRPPAPRSPVISATTPRTPFGQQFFPPLNAGLPPKPTSAVIATSTLTPRATIIAQPARANAPPLASLPVASTSQLPPPPQLSPGTAARIQPNQDLLEMETQKKQELKARRAVLASLKSKKAAALSANAPASPHMATSSTPSIATVAQSVHAGVHPDPVADFLRSVAGVPEEQAAPALVRSPDAMDIDSDGDRPTSKQSSANPAQTFKPPLPPIPSTSSTISSDPLRPELNGGARGVKRSRPVAADFDDGSLSSSSNGSSDNGARPTKRPAIGSSNGRVVQLPHVPDPPPAIRKNSGFSVLNSAWQTPHVINVSDSEDEDDEGPSQHVSFGAASRPAVHNSAAPPARSLSVLEKRELEIQQMKERIAAAEQKKKAQKQALQQPVLSTTSVPAVDELKREVSTPTLADVVLPERHRSVTAPPGEDDEIPGLPTLDRHHSHSRLLHQTGSMHARTPGVEAGLHPSFYRAPFSLHTSGLVMPHAEAGPGRPGAAPGLTRSLDALSASPSSMRPPAVPGSRLTAGSGQGARASSAPHAGDSDDDLYGEAGSSSGHRHGGSSAQRRREGEAQEGHALQGTGGKPISPDRAPQAARIGSLAA